MYKMYKTNMVVALLLICSVFSGCGSVHTGQTHTHQFNQELATEEYLKSEANCQHADEYYYSCVCGDAGTETFFQGVKTFHNYVENIAVDYLKSEANCQHGAEYYKSCEMCGKQSTASFYVEGFGDHDYSREYPSWEYLKSEATLEMSAEFYKSCACGLMGTETFFYGTPLKVYTSAEKAAYTPTSLTITLYDTENSVYGFTWNTESEPLRPVIQLQEGTTLTEDREEYTATVTEATSYDANDKVISYYIVKAEVQLQANETYTYRAYDKYVDVGTEAVTIQALDTKSTAFTFAHVSDSQVTANDNTGVGSGTYFAQTLSQIVGNNDFILHTGDVVQYPKYEGYWKAMLDDNFSYLSQIPVMAISGNHEATGYGSTNHETYKHFNYKLPTQTSTNIGLFYSFVYGNTKFIMLNTNDLTGNKLKSEQYDWLVNELTNNTCTWTVVAMHNPIYSVGKWGANPSQNQICLALRSQLQGIFAEYGVDIVLQGHDHVVSRTYPINKDGQPQTETVKIENGIEYSIDPKGVLYVMDGPAGNQSREPYAEDSTLYKYAQGSKARSWAEFEIDGNKMKVTVKYYDGTQTKTYQTWGIQKTLS